jgi:hypothetical protein
MTPITTLTGNPRNPPMTAAALLHRPPHRFPARIPAVREDESSNEFIYLLAVGRAQFSASPVRLVDLVGFRRLGSLIIALLICGPSSIFPTHCVSSNEGD